MQGKELASKLLSASSFIALFVRHYWRQGMREAHKVLGGTGPAVAQVRPTSACGCASTRQGAADLF